MAVNPFRFRPIEERDRAVILELARNLPDWFNAQGLAQMAQDVRSHQGVVAVEAGRVVGFATWHVMDSETAHLSWLGVAKEVHRNGIGSALVRLVMSQLRTQGIRYLDVSTVADSVDDEPYANTRKFYRAIGFRDFRVDPLFWGEGEDRYDRLVLRVDVEDRP